MSLKIRNLVVGEELPPRLKTGFEATQMPEWIWIAERDGKPVGSLITAPAHIIIILLRLCMTEDAQPTDVRALLLRAIRESKIRGYKGYLSYLDPELPHEKALMSIIEMSHGFSFKKPQVACFGRL